MCCERVITARVLIVVDKLGKRLKKGTLCMYGTEKTKDIISKIQGIM